MDIDRWGQDLQALEGEEDNAYSLIRKYGIRDGGGVNLRKNRIELNRFLRKERGGREATLEDAIRFAEYEWHRETRAEYKRDKKEDHASIYMELEKMADYGAMLKAYHAMGRGDKFREHLEATAKEWVTPQMIYSYELGQVEKSERKHRERLDMLSEEVQPAPGTTWTDTERQEAIARSEQEKKKKYIEMTTGSRRLGRGRYERTEADKKMEISVEAIAAQEDKMLQEALAKHDGRLEILQDAEKSDEEKLELYSGRRFGKDKDKMKASLELLDQELSDPDKMASQILTYEEERKSHYEAMRDEWLAPQRDLEEKIGTLENQMKITTIVLDHAEEAKKDPKKLFEDPDGFLAGIVGQQGGAPSAQAAGALPVRNASTLEQAGTENAGMVQSIEQRSENVIQGIEQSLSRAAEELGTDEQQNGQGQNPASGSGGSV